MPALLSDFWVLNLHAFYTRSCRILFLREVSEKVSICTLCTDKHAKAYRHSNDVFRIQKRNLWALKLNHAPQ